MSKEFTIIFSALAALFFSVSCTDRGYEEFSGYAQGGTYRVAASMKGIQPGHKKVAGDIDAILTGIDTTISGYNRNSMLSRFNAGERIQPNRIFLDLYDRSWEYHEMSGGAFDVAAGPLFDIWGFGFRNDSLPSADKIAEAMARSGMIHLKKDIRACLDSNGFLSPTDLTLDGSQPTLNFNAIAQGYSSDLVAAYLHDLGVKDMLVDIGEIYCEGVNASGKGWSIGIDNPVDGNNSPGADMRGIWQSDGGSHGVVTSGNYRKFYIRDGRKYAHTIDPRSGYPVEHHLLSATVIAPDATYADAIATACMVLGTEDAKSFIESRPDLEACLISDEGMWTSEGFTLRK